jgi:hypothetical protein
MDFAETFADMVLFLVLWHVIGGLTDWIVMRTMSRAYDGEARSAEALESIADTLAELESRLISAPPKKGGK